MKALPIISLVALLLSVPAPRASAQIPSVWRAQQLRAMDESDAIMKRARERTDLLAQYQVMRRAYAASGQPAFRAIFGQYLSWYQSFIGDYRDAELSFSIEQKPSKDDHASPLGQPGWHAVTALAYLPQLARNHRVVFLNEAHNIALTRTLTVRLLKPLREEGFNVFAVETLYPRDVAALNQRGYPIAASGFYTREPIYAEMVRTALKLGYRVVAYEADPDHTGNAREAQQASNLWKILKDDPNAKLVVNAGYAHIQKTGTFLGAQSMAEHFMHDSGITPLSIEQTIMIPHIHNTMDHPDYAAIIAAVHPTQPIVFIDRNSKPWSLRPGYDVSVIFPEEQFVRGRPTWAGLWGARMPFTVTGKVCQGHWPCMVSARYAGERDDAIPADRMVLDPVPLMTINDIKVTTGDFSIPVSQLYLRPGTYNLTVTDDSGRRLSSRSITVTAQSASPQGSASAPPRTGCTTAVTVTSAGAQIDCPNLPHVQ